MSLTLRYLLMLVIFTTELSSVAFSAQCQESGWFGEDCKYQCHCENNTSCDTTTGQCTGRCDSDWFGPACQYVSSKFRANGSESALTWLTDNDHETCNTENLHTITVTLETPQPLTWLRLVVNDPDQLSSFYGIHHQYIAIVGCPDAKSAKVDNVTLDIACNTPDVVSHVTLTGSRLETLCSLYISGGRNVALKKETKQPNTFDIWVSSKAVDGNIGLTDPSTTCAHTEHPQKPAWWAVFFQIPVNVMKFMVFSRRDCCQERLVGFKLDTFVTKSDKMSVFSYTDSTPKSSAKNMYSITPSPVISYDVQKAFVTRDENSPYLTLCEVMIFGDSACPSNTFGRECEGRCNCAGGEDCFVSTGGCPAGCAPGYMGGDCSIACARGRYGSGCVRSCSSLCDGSNSDCDPSDGTCLTGCEPGFLPPRCDHVCNMGTYGKRCEKNCSSKCLHSDCHHLTGKCKHCRSGFTGDNCDQVVPEREATNWHNVGNGDEGANNNTVIAVVVVVVVLCAATIVITICVAMRRSRQKQGQSEYDVAMIGPTSSNGSEIMFQSLPQRPVPSKDDYLIPSATDSDRQPENIYETP